MIDLAGSGFSTRAHGVGHLFGSLGLGDVLYREISRFGAFRCCGVWGIKGCSIGIGI